jgi:hypothetical protein
VRESDVLAYCTGLIIVCTVLLVISTVVTIRNCQLLRRLSAGPAGAHDEPPDPGPPPSRRRPAVERYD